MSSDEMDFTAFNERVFFIKLPKSSRSSGEQKARGARAQAVRGIGATSLTICLSTVFSATRRS